MSHVYDSYAELAAAEEEGVDYLRTSREPAGATWAVIAIHGGGIEPGTGELADAIAGDRMRFYEFDGIKSSGNSDLHITSTLFDEPICVALVADSSRTISLHGMAGADGVAETAIGGLDTDLRDRIKAALTAAGFTVTTASEEINGDDPANICNENGRNAGVQLELSRALRESFFIGGNLSKASRDDPDSRTPAFDAYVAAIQSTYEGRGIVSLDSINVSRWALLPALPDTDVDCQVTCSTDALAVGGPHFLALGGRVVDTDNCYLLRLAANTDQTMTLTLRKRVGGVESFLGQFDTSLTHAVDAQYTMRLRIEGDLVRGKVWAAGTSEPGWQAEVTDTDLVAAGQVGVRTILSSANTNVLPVRATYDDFTVHGGNVPQRFAVVRSVNGISKTHKAGTDVRLAQPAIVAW